jgi:CheY-like chemotaxis protein
VYFLLISWAWSVKEDMGMAATILVVDDHSVSRECTAALLRANGYDVVRAANGADALEVLDHCGADLALVDVLMPEMDGLELLKELKGREKWGGMPVVLVTGVVDPELKGRSKELGADGLLVKARFSPDQLLETVAQHLPSGAAAA